MQFIENFMLGLINQSEAQILVHFGAPAYKLAIIIKLASNFYKLVVLIGTKNSLT